MVCSGLTGCAWTKYLFFLRYCEFEDLLVRAEHQLGAAPQRLIYTDREGLSTDKRSDAEMAKISFDDPLIFIADRPLEAREGSFPCCVRRGGKFYNDNVHM